MNTVTRENARKALKICFLCGRVFEASEYWASCPVCRVSMATLAGVSEQKIDQTELDAWNHPSLRAENAWTLVGFWDAEEGCYRADVRDESESQLTLDLVTNLFPEGAKPWRCRRCSLPLGLIVQGSDHADHLWIFADGWDKREISRRKQRQLLIIRNVFRAKGVDHCEGVECPRCGAQNSWSMSMNVLERLLWRFHLRIDRSSGYLMRRRRSN